MIILDSDSISSGISKNFIRLPGEDDESYLNRVTHLHCQNKGIREIGDLSSCRNLTVLYLYDNRIEQIANLEAARNLTMLYLQNNLIKRIENLTGLNKLKKLYLSRNRISVIEGINIFSLQTLINLEELHIDHQMIDETIGVVFDPRSCSSLKSLHYLNASNNQIKALTSLDLFESLETIDIRDNKISDPEHSINILASLRSLKHLEMRNNPVMKKIRFREDIIASCQLLETLNNTRIHENSKIMLSVMKNKRKQFENKSLK